VLAQVPLSVLFGLGKPAVPAKLQLVQLALYGFTAYYFAQVAGITGVAIAWMLRAGIDLALMMFATDKLLASPAGDHTRWFSPGTLLVMGTMLIMFWFLGATPMDAMGFRLGMFSVLFLILLAVEWYLVFDRRDRETFFGLLSRIRTIS
jgi:hypothetical protein